MSVDSPDGAIVLPVRHRVVNENDDNMQSSITVTMQGKEMNFKAETTEEALIELARALPDGWSIKSCLSCRYGHFCPVGNADNELFCVTEFEPREIKDLWYVTENAEERAERRRDLFFLCSQYMPQSDDYFSYNDYNSSAGSRG